MKNALLLKSTLALALATPLMASADAQLITGQGANLNEATARLDLRVVIPRVLFLGVGSGSGLPLDNSAVVDELTFDYSTNPLDVGVAGAAAGSITSTGPTAASPAPPASIPVRVFGNNGQITISSENQAFLISSSNSLDTIPFSELSVTSSNSALAAPAFSGGTSQPALTGRVTNQTANWIYSYANSTAPAFGEYVGRVTYTATMP